MNKDIETYLKDYTIKRGVFKKVSNNHSVTIENIVNTIRNLLIENRNYTALPEIDNLPVYLQQKLDEVPEPDFYHSEEEYITAKIHEYGFTLSPRGDKVRRSLPNGNIKTVDVSDIEVKLTKDLDLYNTLINGIPGARKYKVTTLMATLKSMLQDNDLNYLSSLQDTLIYEDSKLTTLDKWLKNLHAVMEIKESYDIWEMLMKHMMWLVKRRLFGLDVKYDIWISMFGGQNVGKTYVFTECIFKPLYAYYVMTELSKIEDVDREIQKFTENFVVNFDEIALGNSGDEVYKVSDKMLNNLKSILTRSELYVRRMGGQDQMKLDKSFVAVSSANTHLYDIIFDRTGMRRFFEFNTEATKQYDNKIIATLAKMSTDAWKGIDERKNSGYWEQLSETGKEISKIQKSYRPKNNVAEWIRGEKVIESDIKMQVKHAYTSYRMFCNAMGLKPYALPTFRDTLSYHVTVTDDECYISFDKTGTVNCLEDVMQPMDF